MQEPALFHKFHGLGNDFVLFDFRNSNANNLNQKSMIEIANRKTGIGCDQIIILNDSPNFDAKYQFFNSDGSESEQCGNGQRCISHYLHFNDSQKTHHSVEGLAGVVKSEFNNHNDITVFMGDARNFSKKVIDGETVYDVDIGNPHRIFVVDDVGSIDLEATKKKLTTVDVNFEAVELINKNDISIRVHERGVGETLACGSGACAAVYALQQVGLVQGLVNVNLPGGDLVIEYDGSDMKMTGPSRYVFKGELFL